jgi:penicillin amidase
MPVSGIVRVVNYALAVAALCAGLAFWWLFWRTLPETSGTMRAPVSAAVEIRRDSQGVPHIAAKSIDDALFAQGYVTAQDRLWQMDALRRLAAGDLAEIAGPPALESDTRSRKLRMRRIAETALAALPDAERKCLAAYARGVNHYLDTHRGRWSPEFTLLRYDPRPWSMADSILALMQMDRMLSASWERDLRKGRLSGAGDEEKVEMLYPDRTGGEPRPGSNAWAVSGQWTASGKPMLASDPHLEWSHPAVWHLAALSAPGLEVAGAALPGVPGIIIGHNRSIAWGITALQFDTEDLYLEELDPRDGRYRFGDRQLMARREAEWIAVKGARPAQVINFITVHGPIFTAVDNRMFALKTVREVTASQYRFVILDLNRAANWGEFRSALRNLTGPGINVAYADVNGNIGLQVAGRLPIREGFSGSVPLAGLLAKEEWSGLVPFDQLPSVYNPPSGIVATSNQNPFPEETPYPVGGFFASPHRVLQVLDRLRARRGWTPAAMMTVQTDIYSGFLRFVAGQAVAAVRHRDSKDPRAHEGARLLEGWNGLMQPGAAPPLIAELLYRQVRRTIGERASPKAGAEWNEYIDPGVVENMLKSRPKGWFDDWDMMLEGALADAFDQARRQQGRNPSKWTYGRTTELTLEHPVFGRIGWLAGWFNLGPVAMSGSSTTVRQTTSKLGPSLRFVADLSDWDGSLWTITAGESGHRFSGHFKDQWEAYLSGGAFPMQFRQVRPESTLVLQP